MWNTKKNKEKDLLKYIKKLYDIQKQVDKYFGSYMATKSLDLLTIVIIGIGDLIKDKPNFLSELKERTIYCLNQETIKKYTKIIKKLENLNNHVEIQKILNELEIEIQNFIEEDKLWHLSTSFEETIDGISEEEIKNYYYNNLGLSEQQIISKAIKEQEIKNNTPNISKSDLFEKYPDFLESIDKDGLVNISNLNVNWSKEGVCYKDYFIYFDNLFLDLGIHQSFIFEFMYLFDKKKNNSCKIKLNLEKIISKDNYRELILLGGMHFGPEFSLDKFFTKADKTLFTRKKRLNKKFDKSFNNKIFYTDFFIDQKNNSFLIEEIGENKYNGGFYLNRLIHSEFDIDKKVIKHFDGSILYYEKDNLNIRKEVLLSTYPKLSFKKNKLFRIDGEIDFETYKDILFGFYEWNEMILEYFDLEEYKKRYEYILDYENGIDY